MAKYYLKHSSNNSKRQIEDEARCYVFVQSINTNGQQTLEDTQEFSCGLNTDQSKALCDFIPAGVAIREAGGLRKKKQTWGVEAASIRGCGEMEIFVPGWKINALFVVNSLPLSQKEMKHRNTFPSGIPLLCRVKRI